MSAACLVGVAVLGLAVRSRVPVVDSWLHDVARHHRGAVLGIARTVTQGGSTWLVWPMVALAALTFPRSTGGRRLAMAAVVAAGAGAAVGVRLAASQLLQRARPPRADWAAQANGFAFPSGHTTAATIGAGLLAWALARRLHNARARAVLWACAVVYAGAVGWSRIWLGVHWPLDVVGGWLFGVGWLAGMAALVSRLPALAQPPAATGTRWRRRASQRHL